MSDYLYVSVSSLDDIGRLSESEQGRLFAALLRYAATGTKEEPRGTERVFFEKMCNAHDAQYIYINSNNTQSQVSDSSTSNLSSYTESFERFWNVWPCKYKVNRKRCIELWKKIKPDDALVDKMIESVEAWKKSRQWQQGYVPNPDTWLRGEKWNDANPDPWTDKRNSALNYKQTPISQDDFDAMTVNLDEIRFS